MVIGIPSEPWNICDTALITLHAIRWSKILLKVNYESPFFIHHEIAFDLPRTLETIRDSR